MCKWFVKLFVTFDIHVFSLYMYVFIKKFLLVVHKRLVHFTDIVEPSGNGRQRDLQWRQGGHGYKLKFQTWNTESVSKVKSINKFVIQKVLCF